MADANLTLQVSGRDNLSAELKRIESGVIRFVGAVSSAFTTIAAIGFPIKEAADFQKEILNAARTTNYGAEQMEVMAKGLRQLSTEIDITAVDLAKIATLGGQMGIGANNAKALVAFTEQIATAVTALDLPAEEVVNSFGKLITIFDIPQEKFRNAMSAILAVANASTVGAEQLFDVVRRIGDLGGAVSLPEAAALSGAMIDLGLTAETAGTTLTKIFADFKAKASEFAVVVHSEAIPTTEAWINLIQGNGVQALNAYADALNKMSVADASRIKGSLTGEGRLFEAISKIQNQRLREQQLSKLALEAEGKLDDAIKGRTEATTAGVAALKSQAEALRAAADNASVIGRLSQTAQEAFTRGDVAEKAQKLILTGLTKQWEVFIGNIKALAAEAGDVFLPPLTEALKAASAALKDPVNADSLKNAAKDIIDAFRAIGDGIKSVQGLFQGLKGSGFDWGAILRIGALLVGFAALKGLLSLLKALGATIAGGIPGASALASALTSTGRAAAGAATAVTGAGTAAARTGNIFATAGGNIAAGLTRITNATHNLRQSISAQQAAAIQANVDILSQRRLANLQSIAAINAEITRQQQRQAALAANPRLNARTIAGIGGDITFLTRQRDAILANQALAARLQQTLNGIGVTSLVSAGAENAFAGFMRRTIARVLDFQLAWANARTVGEKALLGLATGVSVLGRVLGFVAGLVGKAFSLAFIALMSVEVLKAIGLWDSLSVVISDVLKKLGIKVPSFLQSEADARQSARAIDAVAKAYEGADKQASKLTNDMKAMALVAQDANETAKELTFDPQDPSKSIEKSIALVDALGNSYTTVVSIEGRLVTNAQRLTEELRKQNQAQEDKKTFLGFGTLSGGADRTIAETTANIKKLREEKALLDKQLASFGNLGAGVQNFAKGALSLADAFLLLGKDVDDAEAPLLTYAKNAIFISRQVAEATRIQKEYEEAFKNAKSPEEAADAEKVRAASLGVLNIKVAEATEQNKKLADSFKASAENFEVVKSMLKFIDTNTDPAGLLRYLNTLKETSRVAENFKGTALPKIQANNIIEAAALFEVSRRLGAMYKTWAEQAKATAEAAQNYAKQVAGEIVKLAKQTEATLERLRSSQTANANKASNQLADRVDDRESRQRKRDIQTQYDFERALLEQQFSIRNRSLAEQEAGGVRVFSQKMEQYAAEQQALFELEEKFRRMNELEDDRLNLKKASRGAKQEIVEFDALNAKAEAYRRTVAEADAILANPSSSADQKGAAIEKRNQALIGMKVNLDEIEKKAEKIASIEPIGGQLVIPTSELQRQASAVQSAADLMGTAMQTGAQNIATATKIWADALSAQATEMDAIAGQAQKRIGQFGVPMNEAAEFAGKLLGNAVELEKVIVSIQNITQSGLINPGTINTVAIGRLRDDMVTELGKLKPVDMKVEATTEGLAAEVTQAILKGVDEASTKAKEIKVPAGVKDESFEAMKLEIENKVKPKVKVEAEVEAKIRWSNPSNPQPGFWRGGLIGDVMQLSNSVSRFASGSLIRGPGGPTDDSILARLSNGEYVSDALTTATFGPKFFAMLKQIAHSGVSLSFLRNFRIPQFAGGGVATPFAVPSGIASDFKLLANNVAKARDTIDIRLTSGNKEATIQAEREQANSLVAILQSFTKG